MVSIRSLAFFTIVVLTVLSMLGMVTAAPIPKRGSHLNVKRFDRAFRGRPMRNRLQRHPIKASRVLVQNQPVPVAQSASATTTAEPPTTTTTTTITTTTTKHVTTTTEAPQPTPKPTSTKTTTHAKPTSTSGGSSGGSGKYTGDATWYNTGLGSCGITSSESDLIVALNAPQMANGANPNSNPKCGEKITIHGPKGSVVVTIVDTCPACASGDLDLSPAAFQKIADLNDGRVTVTWDYA